MNNAFNSSAADRARAVLVHIDFRNTLFNEELDEFVQLTRSCGLADAVPVTGRRDAPDARFFVGKGKVEEIKTRILEANAGIVVFNHELTPAQERNLEQELNCRVLDRVGLILDIFAQRARSYEGMLQVELAQLQHLSTRLVRGWSHLERQKGGIGLRGPGETQLETDRRLIGKRMKTINARLEKVRSQREQGRRLRRRRATPVISLVGYTNAGKSTLFNHLTGATVYAADKLFATLDPTLRRVDLPGYGPAILSDTVGFIRHIPHDLIKAFHATLQEVREADLLVHVIDASADERHGQMQQVDQVIGEIGASGIPQVLVYNKIDLNHGGAPRVEHNEGGPARVWLSAATGAGVEQLKEIMSAHFSVDLICRELRVPADAGGLRAGLFDCGAVRTESRNEDGGWTMHVRLDTSSLERLCRNHGVDPELLH